MHLLALVHISSYVWNIISYNIIMKATNIQNKIGTMQITCGGNVLVIDAVPSYSSLKENFQGSLQLNNYVTSFANYAHHGKEQFSSSMDSSINKLTNYQYTTTKC